MFVRYILTSLFISLQKLFSFSRKSDIRILDIQISWRHQMPKNKTRNTFYWLMWEINSPSMKFGQYMWHYNKKKKISIFITKTAIWKLVLSPFVFAKNNAQTLLENEMFETSYLYYICNSKTIKICPNQHANLLKFLFTTDSLKIKKGLELVSRPHFS